MNNISDQEVATRGNLNLHAKLCNECGVYAKLFCPIHAASFSLLPSVSLPEGLVESFSDRSCAIGFDLFLEGYYRAKDQLLNLQEEIRKAKPADLVTRSVVKANLCDLHSSGRADCKKIEVFDSTKWARPPIICRGC